MQKTIYYFSFNPFPRKGTETKESRQITKVVRATFNPFPRKGTETMSPATLELPGEINFQSISPQGDGNTSRLFLKE